MGDFYSAFLKGITHYTSHIPLRYIGYIRMLAYEAQCLVGLHHLHPCMKTYPYYVGFDFAFLGFTLLRTRHYPDGLPAGYPVIPPESSRGFK